MIIHEALARCMRTPPSISHRSETCKEIVKNFTRELQRVKKSQFSLHNNKTQQPLFE